MIPQDKTQPLISIIITIFNTDKFLEACLNSVKNQTYKNIEILLINDGSTDSSLEICTKFINCDNRAKVFTQPNGGVAIARSTGLVNSTGDYIIHVDSDDLLPANAIQLLVSRALSSKCDITIGSYIVRRPGKDKIIHLSGSITSTELLCGLLSGKYHGGLWNKLIRRDLYNGIDFEPGIDFMEDKLILVKILVRQQCKIEFLDAPVYIYIQRDGSYTNSMSDRYLKISDIVTQEIFDLTQKLIPNSILNTARNQSRLMILLNTSKPIAKYNSSLDAQILKDRSIPLFKRIPIWGLSIGIDAPIKIYRALFRFLRKTY